MLLVAYLRRIGNRMPDAAERAALGPMITVSDNGRADEIYRRVGDAALRRLVVAGAHAALLGRIPLGRRPLQRARPGPLLPALRPASCRAARAPTRAAAVLDHARPALGFSVTRGGSDSRPSSRAAAGGDGTGQPVHEAALFERRDTRFSMAVLSPTANPSHAYGAATPRGVAERIFRAGDRVPALAPSAAALGRGRAGTPAHRRAGLVDVRRLAPGCARHRLRRAEQPPVTGWPATVSRGAAPGPGGA